MTPFVLGIAGGSGTGKSTLAFALMDKYPEQISILHFDDYQKVGEEIPLLHGFANWDHPEAVDFEKLVHDLNTLKNGEAITVGTWCDERVNPNFAHTKKRVPMQIQPKALSRSSKQITRSGKRLLCLYPNREFSLERT